MDLDVPFELAIFLTGLNGKIATSGGDDSYAVVRARRLPPPPYPPRVYEGFNEGRRELVVDLTPDWELFPRYYGATRDEVQLALRSALKSATYARWHVAIWRALGSHPIAGSTEARWYLDDLSIAVIFRGGLALRRARWMVGRERAARQLRRDTEFVARDWDDD